MASNITESNKKHYFLDEYGVQLFLKKFDVVFLDMLRYRIVGTIPDELDDNRTVSIRLLKTLLSSIYSKYKQLTILASKEDESLRKLNDKIDEIELKYGHLEFKIITGDIRRIVRHPSSRAIYLQRDDINDETWNLYVYIDNEWICIEDHMLVKIGNYIRKDDIALREDLVLCEFVPIQRNRIEQYVENAMM